MIELDDFPAQGDGEAAVYVGYSAKTLRSGSRSTVAASTACVTVRDHGVPSCGHGSLPGVSGRDEPAEAEALERQVAERLRRRGFTVYGGH